MIERLKKIATHVLRISVSFLFLGIVLYATRGRLREALSHIVSIELWPVMVAVGLNFISLIPVTFRLKMILEIQSITIPFWRQYYLWVISGFFNLFLPSAVGGDIAKAYYLYKDSGKKMASVTSVLLDRFFGLVATVSIGFCAFLLVQKEINDPKIGQILYWFIGVILVALLFVLSRRFSKPAKALILKFSPKKAKEHLGRLFEALDLYRAQRHNFFAAFGYSVVAQVVFITMVYFLARSIRVDLPIWTYFLVLPIVTLFSMLPSIGGLGVREAATVYLFRHYVPLDKAVAFSLLFDLFIYGVGAICGILYAIRGGASVREIEDIENET